MKKLIKSSLLLLLLSVIIMIPQGCSKQIMTYSSMSTQHPSIKYGPKGTYVTGKGGTMDAAVNNALSKAGAGYDILIDGKVIMHHYSFILFYVATFTVEGTAMKSSEITAQFGEKAQGWMQQHRACRKTN